MWNIEKCGEVTQTFTRAKYNDDICLRILFHIYSMLFYQIYSEEKSFDLFNIILVLEIIPQISGRQVSQVRSSALKKEQSLHIKK